MLKLDLDDLKKQYPDDACEYHVTANGFTSIQCSDCLLDGSPRLFELCTGKGKSILRNFMRHLDGSTHVENVLARACIAGTLLQKTPHHISRIADLRNQNGRGIWDEIKAYEHTKTRRQSSNKLSSSTLSPSTTLTVGVAKIEEGY